MKILVCDTSGGVASCALAEEGKIIAEINLRTGLTHSEKLLPAMEAALRLADWTFQDLEALGIVAGPGSFTGLRIGAATVKGLAFALDLPVVPVGTLETLAWNLPGFKGIVVPMLDARRGEVYAAAYRWTNGRWDELLSPRAESLDLLLKELPECTDSFAFLGDGITPNEEKLQQYPGAFLVPEALRLQKASCAAQAAFYHIAAGDLLSAADFLPDYLRGSSAVPPEGLKLWDF